MVDTSLLSTSFAYFIVASLIACGSSKKETSSGNSGDDDGSVVGSGAASKGGGVVGGTNPVADQSNGNDKNTMSLMVESESKRPNCEEANQSQLIYVLDAKEFQVCSAGNWAAIDITGPRGETGPSGGVAIYDANDRYIGYHAAINEPNPLTDGNIIFSNGLNGRFDWASGKLAGTFVWSVYSIDSRDFRILKYWNQCFYTSSNCSGICYFSYSDPNGFRIQTVKNTLVNSSNVLLQATGNESDIGPLTLNSYFGFDSGSCQIERVTHTYNFAITTPATLPDGITLPLATPLWFGVEQQ